MIAAIAILEARARGNRIIYNNGRPDDALGEEGDLGVNRANGDFYEFTAGTFHFLYNSAGRAGVFVPIAENEFGIHPEFTEQYPFNKWVLQNRGGGTPVPTITSFAPASAAVDASVTITGTNFGATAGTVKFNGILANTASWNATTIVAKVPTGGATGRIMVTTAAGTVVTSAGTFTVIIPAPFKDAIVGDSIYSEDYGTPSTPTLVSANYAQNTDYKGRVGNWAHSGDTIRDQINKMKAAPPIYDGSVDTYFLVEVLVNTLGVGARTNASDESILAGAQNDLLELHQLIRSYGPRYFTIASTAIAAGILVGQPYDAAIEAKQFRLIQKANTWLRSGNYSSVLGAVVLNDRMSDRLFDQLSDTNNSTNYLDHVHPTVQARQAVEGPMAIRSLDAARFGQFGIITGNRDTSVNLDYVEPDTPSVQIIEDSSTYFSKNGNWQLETGNSAYTDGSAIFSTVIGDTLLIDLNMDKLEFFTADIANGGVIRMRITDTADNEVYNQTFDHAAAGVTRATGSTPKLVALLPGVATYHVAFTALGGTVSGTSNVAVLDYLRATGGTGTGAGGGGAISFEAENSSLWTDTGTWGISEASVWSGGGKGAFTNDAGNTRTFTRTLSRVQLITLNEPGPGVFRLRITSAGGNTVYDQQAAVNRQPYQSVTDQNSALLDSGMLPLASYKVELIVVTGPAAYDNMRVY